MKWVPDPFPVRVMTEEDAVLLMECIRDKKYFPREKYVWPYIVVNGRSEVNPLYDQAPYELGFLNSEDL
jgi:hypothetical protein